VESAAPGDGLRLRLLGAPALTLDGRALALPPSRKVLALVAYLALAPRPVARARLCELLWEVPDDPRGELRWCLSKARRLLDADGRARVVAHDDTLALDLAGVAVDALEVERAVQAGVAALDAPRLRHLAGLFAGDFAEGLAVARAAPFAAWLIAERRRFRAHRAVLLERLVDALPAGCDEALRALEQWVQVTPFQPRAHERLLDALARRGRLRDGDEHLAATARRFEAEALDWAPLGRAWHAARALQAALPAGPRAPDEAPRAAARRASVAVMPFADHSAAAAPRGGLADGLVHDLITRLARLRSLFVIAQGTVFALDERGVDAAAAGRLLGVDYVADGWLRREGTRVAVGVQLAETRGACIVWAEDYAAPLGDTLGVLDTIADRIVAAIDAQVEATERHRALLAPADSLDAWQAHHRGLWHMYRFNRADNERAQQFFRSALRIDPTFARPWAGLSFTHFQNAFLAWGEHDGEVEAAYRAAAEGLMADERDPVAHWAMGRALWLRGQLEPALAELDAAIALSPNFALGHYTLAFVHAQSGDPQAAIRYADHSRELSPFDPLLFAMLASRALALLRLGRHDEAADWAVRGAARPNAHVHILGIAAHCLALAGRLDEARGMAAAIARRTPGYRGADLLAAFRFAPPAAALLERGARRIGLQ
jgi:DNA-binding SARP family transcriptional activator